MQHAIGIAAIQVNGMHASFGTDTKPFHVGRAAQSGLMAALLAQRGFTASMEGLEAERGWVNVVSTKNNITGLFSTLGKIWGLSLNTFKPFPCDRIIHAAIDGWIQIHDQMKEQGLDAADITNVSARCHPRVLFLTDDPTPSTGLAGKFSVYHAAAVAILDGAATPAQFTDEAVQNKTVISLREKVSVKSDDTVEEHEASVTVDFKGGKSINVHVEHCVGSYENPMTAEQLEVKFMDQVTATWDEEKAQKAFQFFSSIVNATEVGGIAGHIA